MQELNDFDIAKKAVQDFFTAIIDEEVVFTNYANLYTYELTMLSQVTTGDLDIFIKSFRLPNYKYSYWVYIPDGTTLPQWQQVEVHDKAEFYNELTGKSTTSWRVEKLRFSEITAIKKRLELYKKERFDLSDAERIYFLGSAEIVADLAVKITHGIAPEAPSS